MDGQLHSASVLLRTLDRNPGTRTKRACRVHQSTRPTAATLRHNHCRCNHAYRDDSTLFRHAKDCQALAAKIHSVEEGPHEDSFAAADRGQPPSRALGHTFAPFWFLALYRDLGCHLLSLKR